MNKPLALVTGIGIGGGLMYLFDPDRGKRRRALIRDKTVHAVHDVNDAISKTSRDLGNRARGIVAEARSVFSSGELPDDVLKARVQSKIGRLVTHASAIDIEVDDGAVTLRGDVLSDEVRDLVRGVSAMHGVTSVHNRLSVHDTAEDIPALQGRSRWTARRDDSFQANWSPATRFLVGAAGGALAVYGVTRRNWWGAGASALGAALLTRGISNREIRRLVGLKRAA